ncbi:MAG: LysR family transcriptional regulator [Deltaproteobacteria bacterium]|nr:LysR family transcriptional regulator [Deltaproteobacteria bacterium]
MLDVFRYVVAIARHGTITAAAREAGISQPALTTALRRLESQLETTLFIRGRKGAELTAAGRALLPHAERAIGAVETGVRAVREVEGLSRGEVRVAAGATVCTYVLPPVIASFRKKHPGIRFAVTESTQDEAMDALEKGEVDLAVLGSRAGEALLVDEMIVVASPKLEVVADTPIVAFRAGGSTRQLSDRYLASREIAMELGSVGAVLANVEAGVGVALVSRVAALRGLGRGTLVEVPDPRMPIVRTLRLVHRGRHLLSPAAASFRRALLAAREAKVSTGPERGRR